MVTGLESKEGSRGSGRRTLELRSEAAQVMAKASETGQSGVGGG